jgi:hypothetical protein
MRLRQFRRHVARRTGIGQPGFQLIQGILTLRLGGIVLFFLHLHVKSGQFRGKVGGNLTVGLNMGHRRGGPAGRVHVGGGPNNSLDNGCHLGGDIGALRSKDQTGELRCKTQHQRN